ncbi:hypothetical protein [Paraburkholderia sp.]|uniref:hypothetical protein n=1 Tax=Paraburkholderia sp. TaxID=1926495 RepID=UPI0039E71872
MIQKDAARGALSCRHASFTLRRLPLLIGALIGVAATQHAHAELACDAPWMHTNGGYTTTISPGDQKIDYLVTSFSKHDGNNCNFDLRVNMKLAIPGHDSAGNVGFHVTIDGGKVHIERQTAKGNEQSHTDQVAFSGIASAQTTGLLSYVGEITGEGQRLAGTRTESSVSGKVAMGPGGGSLPVSIPRTVISTTEKQVGKQEQLTTAVGKYECWPVSYDQRTQSNGMQLMGRTVNMDNVVHVVDHFCPAAGLVMRSERTGGGQSSSKAITALH